MSGWLAAARRWLSGKRAPTFEAFQGPSGQWFVRKVAANGETVSVSEGYGGPKSKDQGRQSARVAAMRQAAEIPGARWRLIPLPKPPAFLGD